MSEASPDLLLLHALADQELDAAAALSLERRLGAEPALAAEYDRIVATKAAMAHFGGRPYRRTFSIASLRCPRRIRQLPHRRHITPPDGG